MTSNITIGSFKNIKPHSFHWERSRSNFTDTAKIKLPAIAMLKKEGDQYQRVQTGLQFEEGMKVEINAGYGGANDLQFKGFVSRRNFTIPMELECEGYAYQLRKKIGFNKSYTNTTVKKILIDLIAGTDIKLSDAIPDVPLAKATFQNVTGTQVLEWFKEKCLLTVCFDFDVLYVGLLEVSPTIETKFRLGWNTVKDGELKFNNKKEFAEVRINVQKRGKNGKKSNAIVGKKDGQVKVVKSVIDDPVIRQRIAEQVKNNLVNKGYEGSITAFLKPFVQPGQSVSIEDTNYPERTGKYFVTGIKGEFGTSGGRQKIMIGNSL